MTSYRVFLLILNIVGIVVNAFGAASTKDDSVRGMYLLGVLAGVFGASASVLL